MKQINKGEYLKSLKCLRYLWLLSNENYKYNANYKELTNFSDDLSEEDEEADSKISISKDGLDAMDGIAVGKLARSYFEHKYGKKNCLNCENINISNEALLKKPYKVFFEPLFQINNALTRLDILIKINTNEFHVIEVKSTTKPKLIFFEDIKYQLCILKTLKINVTKCQLMHINADYLHYGINDFETNFEKLSEFFIISDELFDKKNKVGLSISEKILNYDCQEEFHSQCEKAVEILNLKEMSNELKAYKVLPRTSQCHMYQQCEFKKYCLKNYQNIDQTHLKNTVYGLPGANHLEINKLIDKNIFEIKDISADFIYEKWQKRKKGDLLKSWKFMTHIEMIQNNQDIKINKFYLHYLFNQVWNYPIYMLDFEAVSSAIPIFSSTKPYSHVVFQYSIHIIENINDLVNKSKIIHKEFFYDFKNKNKSIQEQVIQNLIKDLACDKNGTILAYHKSYEKSRIKELIEYCKLHWLSEKKIQILRNILDRIHDLKDVFSNLDYYDVNFLSKSSIKIVLPIIEPSLTYKNLEIQNGLEAANTFKLLYKEFLNKTITTSALKKQIMPFLEYCKLDTWAMVVIMRNLYMLVYTDK